MNTKVFETSYNFYNNTFKKIFIYKYYNPNFCKRSKYFKILVNITIIKKLDNT